MTTLDNREDAFERHFEASSHGEFFELLDELEKDTKWDRVPLKEISFVPLSEVREEELSLGAGKAYEDSKKGFLPIVACFADGRKYLVREYLLKFIKDHAEDNGKIVSKIFNAKNWQLFCAHINCGWEYRHKEIIYLLRGEKISSWMTDFNSNWSQLKQFEFFEEKMGERFPGFSFSAASIGHYFSSASYRLDDSIESHGLAGALGVTSAVMGAYIDAWRACGLEPEELKSAVPVCRFLTGESGLCAIEAIPVIQTKNYGEIVMGESLKVVHRGSDEAVWGQFETFPDNIAVLFQKGLAGLELLCKLRIMNPYNAVTRILKMFRATMPSETMKACAETASFYWAPSDKDATCKAVEIYHLVNEFVKEGNEKRKNPLVAFRNVELMGRLLHANWKDFDKPTALKVGGKAEEIDLPCEG